MARCVLEVLVLLSCCTVFCFCCINISIKDCPAKSEKSRCLRKNDTIICCNVTDFTLTEGLNIARISQNTTKAVFVHNATLSVLNGSLDRWTKLDRLVIVDGKIKKVTGQFRGNLACVNLARNNISEVYAKAFLKLPQLTELDLSGNFIPQVPNVTIHQDNFTIDISNNSNIWCNGILNLMVKYQNTSNLFFRNPNNTICLSARSFHWFNSTDAMPLSQLQLLTKRTAEDCPEGCTCRTYRADIIQHHAYLEVKLSVNCSNRQLTQLPPLPANTIYLDVSNNYITSLRPLCTNQSYTEVREFIADNNWIDSISVLEGSKFIDNFAILSIRNNRIRAIPTYILSNSFDRTFHQNRIVRFGGNRLVCDCSSALVKMWLINNKNYIEDYNEILCESGFQKVIEVDPSKVCITAKDWRDYIYYIIALEVFLLVTLFSKVTYDYYIFKSFGYLPWPASRMPKLPCDWCFEP